MTTDNLTQARLKNIISTDETDAENKDLETTLKQAIQTGVNSDIKELVTESIDDTGSDELINKMLDPKQNYLNDFCAMLPEGMQDALTNRLRSYVIQVIHKQLESKTSVDDVTDDQLNKLKAYFTAKNNEAVDEPEETASTSSSEVHNENDPAEQGEAPPDTGATQTNAGNGGDSSTTSSSPENVNTTDSPESDELVFDLNDVELKGTIDLAQLDDIKYIQKRGMLKNTKVTLSSMWASLEEDQKKQIYAKLAEHIVQTNKLKNLESQAGIICAEFRTHLESNTSTLTNAEKKVYLAIMHKETDKLTTDDANLSTELDNIKITGLDSATFTLNTIPFHGTSFFAKLPNKADAALIGLKIKSGGKTIDFAKLADSQISSARTNLETAYKTEFEAAFNKTLTDLNSGTTPTGINGAQFKTIVETLISSTEYPSIDQTSVKNLLKNVNGNNRDYMKELYLPNKLTKSPPVLDSNPTAQLILRETAFDFDISKPDSIVAANCAIDSVFDSLTPSDQAAVLNVADQTTLDTHYSKNLTDTDLNDKAKLFSKVPKGMAQTNAAIYKLIIKNLGVTSSDIMSYVRAFGKMLKDHEEIAHHYNIFASSWNGDDLLKYRMVSQLKTESYRNACIFDENDSFIKDIRRKLHKLEAHLNSNDRIPNSDSDLQILALLLLKDASAKGEIPVNRTEIDLSSKTAEILTEIQKQINTRKTAATTDFGTLHTVKSRTDLQTNDATKYAQTVTKAITLVDNQLNDFITDVNKRPGHTSDDIIHVQQTLDMIMSEANGGLNNDEKAAFAIYFNIKFDVGSDPFEKSLRTKLESLAMEETGLDLLDDAYEDMRYDDTDLEDVFKQSVFRDVLSKYKEKDLNDPEVRNEITNEVTNRMMEERLRIIEERIADTPLLDKVTNFASGALNLVKKSGLPFLATTALGTLTYAASGAKSWAVVGEGMLTGLGGLGAAGSWIGGLVSNIWGGTLLAGTGMMQIGFLQYAAIAGTLIAGGSTLSAMSKWNLPPFMKGQVSLDQAMANVTRHGGSMSIRNGQLEVKKLGDQEKSSKNEIQKMKAEFKRKRRDIMKDSRNNLKSSISASKSRSQSIFELVDTAYNTADLDAAKTISRGGLNEFGNKMSGAGQIALLGMPKLTGYLYKKFV